MNNNKSNTQLHSRRRILLAVGALAFGLVGLTPDAEAQRGGRAGNNERFVIQMDGQQYRGSQIIRLKQEIRQQNGRIRLKDYDLKRVRVVAVSRRGRGTATLMINGQEQDRARIGGSPQEFRNNRYDRMALYNYGDSQGTWQLSLRGNIKIKKIVVVAEKIYGGGWGDDNYGGDVSGRVNWLSESSEKKADKMNPWIAPREHYISFRESGNVIAIEGTEGKVEISSVTVHTRGGGSYSLHQLTGSVRAGEILKASIPRGLITSVQISAYSTRLIGGRGKFKVKVGQSNSRRRRRN